MQPVSFSELKEVVTQHFPELWIPTEACLAVATTLALEDLANPIGLNLVGPPSSGKTTVLRFFDGSKWVYRSDKFTPKSFVSHFAQVSKKKRESLHLLPRIRRKVLIVAELAPLFGARREDLTENISLLTRVFDGQGLSTDSGAEGRIDLVGDYTFAWLGATTPPKLGVWETMGKLGHRWLWLAMDSPLHTTETLYDELTAGLPYNERVKVVRERVVAFLDGLMDHLEGYRGYEWPRHEDGEQRSLHLEIVRYAQFLARLRGTVSLASESEWSVSGYTPSLIEDPKRAATMLWDIARAHALVCGRDRVTDNDLEIVFRIVVSSCPEGRRLVVCHMLQNKTDTITSAEAQNVLGCSRPTARSVLRTLAALGLGEIVGGEEPGKSTTPLVFRLADQWAWIVASEKPYCEWGPVEGAEKKLTV